MTQNFRHLLPIKFKYTRVNIVGKLCLVTNSLFHKWGALYHHPNFTKVYSKILMVKLLFSVNLHGGNIVEIVENIFQSTDYLRSTVRNRNTTDENDKPTTTYLANGTMFTEGHPQQVVPQTRGELKKKLLQEVPKGAESAFLKQTTECLQEMQTSLQRLQTQRTELRRLITVRERKLKDWKCKIPRYGPPPSVDSIRESLTKMSTMRACAIGCMTPAGHILFAPEFRGGLTGLAGFDKAWIVVIAPENDVLSCASCSTISACVSTSSDSDPLLLLVDVLACNIGSGVVRISRMCGESQPCLSGGLVVDVKPYLSYCEAWPDPSQNNPP